MAGTQQAVGWSFGRGRGFRPSQPYKPSRRPREPDGTVQPSVATPGTPGTAGIQVDFREKCSIESTGDTLAQQPPSNPNASQDKTNGGSGKTSKAESPGSRVKSSGLKAGETVLRTKYSYKANPESPLGQKELGIQQGSRVVFLETCGDNDMWWKVRREDGQEGFVPASYLEVKSDKVTQLPWLAAKQTAEESELPKVKPEWKPYVSAYNHEGNVKEGGAAANKEQYYCKWCDKQLNGPKPYGAHITSKAHKEEIELAKEYGTYTED